MLICVRENIVSCNPLKRLLQRCALPIPQIDQFDNAPPRSPYAGTHKHLARCWALRGTTPQRRFTSAMAANRCRKRRIGRAHRKTEP